MAEELFRMEASHSIISTEVQSASAGIAAITGTPPSKNAVQAMREIGRDISTHRSTLLSAQIVQSVDYIYTMTYAHQHIIVQEYPEAISKVKPLVNGHDIMDPFGGDIEMYRECRDEIHEAIKQLLPKLIIILRS